MHLAKHLLLLAAALTVIAAGSAAAQGLFDSVPANASCVARTVSAAARGEIECAVWSSASDTSRSFSFMNGVCVLSDSPDCTVSGVTSVFRKRLPSTSQSSGYVQIGDRRFWVFQQRQTGQVLFNRTWTEYESGFGNDVEFWSGLKQIHNFTQSRTSTLRVEMTTVGGNFYFAEWLNFTVADASTNYIMNSGAMNTSNIATGCDTLSTQRGMQFSTWDRDNDAFPSGSCSVTVGGSAGFWFGYCFSFNPNGLYMLPLQVTTNAEYISSSCVEGCMFLRAIRMMLQM